MPKLTIAQQIERAKPEAEKLLRLPAPDIADPGSDRVDHLVDLALKDYRRRFPQCSARNPRPWLFYDGDPTTIKIKVGRDGKPKSERVDVYCTFCRILLVNGAIWNHDYTERLRPHTTVCALKSLAGQLEPGAPGTYKLPEAV